MKRRVSTYVMLESIEELLENAEKFDADEKAYRFLYKMREVYKRIDQEELKERQKWGIFS